MGTTTGEFRETLIEAITAVRQGKLDADDARAIAELAKQVSLNLQVEMNLRRQEVGVGSEGVALIGQQSVGDEAPRSTRGSSTASAAKTINQPKEFK